MLELSGARYARPLGRLVRCEEARAGPDEHGEPHKVDPKLGMPSPDCCYVEVDYQPDVKTEALCYDDRRLQRKDDDSEQRPPNASPRGSRGPRLGQEPPKEEK